MNQLERLYLEKFQDNTTEPLTNICISLHCWSIWSGILGYTAVISFCQAKFPFTDLNIGYRGEKHKKYNDMTL